MRLIAILSPTNKWGTKTEYTKLRKFLQIHEQINFLVIQNLFYCVISKKSKSCNLHILQMFNFGFWF